MKKILAQRGEGAKEELGHSEQGIDECPTLTPATDRGRTTVRSLLLIQKLCGSAPLREASSLAGGGTPLQRSGAGRSSYYRSQNGRVRSIERSAKASGRRTRHDENKKRPDLRPGVLLKTDLA
jgi:hypothetical protein